MPMAFTQRLKSAPLSPIAVFFATSFFILSGQILLKAEFLFSEQPILDDIQILRRAIVENYWYLSRPDVLLFEIIVKEFGVLYGKIVYLMLFSVGSGLWALAIFSMTRSVLFSVLISVAALQSEYTFIYPIFMVASYGLLFLPLLAASIIMIAWIARLHPNHQTGIKYWIAIWLTVIATIIGSILNPNAILVPVVILSALGWLIYSGCGVRDSIGPLLGLVVAGAAFYIYVYIVFDHPYANMEGRVMYNPLDIIKNAISLLEQTIWSAFDARIATGALTTEPNYLFGLLIAGLLLALLWACWKMRKDKVILLFAFLCAALIAASIAPLSPLTRSHLWHYFLHGMVLITIAGVLLRSLSPVLGYAFALGMIFFGVTTNLQAVPTYSAAYAGQEELARFIRQTESSWPRTARVFVFTDRVALGRTGVTQPFRSQSLFELEAGRSIADFRIVITPQTGIAELPEIQEADPDRLLFKWYGEDPSPTLINSDDLR